MKTIAALCLLALASATAAAQPSKSEATDGDSLAAQDCTRARKLGKECVLTFGATEIGGKVISPTGGNFGVIGNSTFSSLIHLRRDFRAEIISAADDI